MLALPLVRGLSVSGAAPAAWGVPVAALLAFLAHYALVPVLQRRRIGRPGPREWTRARWSWGVLYLAGGALAFGVSLGLSPTRATLLLLAAVAGGCAAIYFAAAAFGSGREVWSEVVGMAGMALASPLVAAAAGRLGRWAWTAAAIAFAYSLSSVAFVRAFGALREDRAGATARCLLVHAGVAAVLAALAGAGRIAPWPLVALAPPVFRTAFGLARPPSNLRVLGLRELAVALALAALGIVALAIEVGGG